MSEIFILDDLLAKATRDRRYHEFVRINAMSVGLYVLGSGASDFQLPHKEDEIYYVVRGKAKLRVGGQERSVRSISAASVIFVERGLEHRFFDIEQELVLLVVFAPAESR